VENEEASDDDQADDDAADEAAVADESDAGPTLTTTTKKETVDRTDDPVRMYLREMGAVELLSREGEIAIAKRIEAGRDTMILGLCESPITFNAIIDWSNALNEGTMQLREILDLDAMLSKGPTAEQVENEGEDGEISAETAGPTFKEEDEPEEEEAAADEEEESMTERRAPRPQEEEDEDNTLSLAQMAEQLKPLALERFGTITDLYKSFSAVHAARVAALGVGDDFPGAEEEGC